MYVLIIVFIVFTLLIGLFCVGVVSRDIVVETRESKKAKSAEPEAETAAKAETCATDPEADELPENKPVVLPSEEPDYPVETEEELTPAVPFNDGKVAFSTGSKTLDEKYLELSAECRGYYDDVVRYANTVEGSKRYKNAAYEEYKVGKNRLVRLKIRKDTVICEFVIPNLEFKNYISGNKVAVKQAPATIKVTDEASLAAVKDSIGIAVKAIEEEKAYKKEQAKLRRRQKRESAKAE